MPGISKCTGLVLTASAAISNPVPSFSIGSDALCMGAVGQLDSSIGVKGMTVTVGRQIVGGTSGNADGINAGCQKSLVDHPVLSLTTAGIYKYAAGGNARDDLVKPWDESKATFFGPNVNNNALSNSTTSSSDYGRVQTSMSVDLESGARGSVSVSNYLALKSFGFKKNDFAFNYAATSASKSGTFKDVCVLENKSCEGDDIQVKPNRMKYSLFAMSDQGFFGDNTTTSVGVVQVAQLIGRGKDIPEISYQFAKKFEPLPDIDNMNIGIEGLIKILYKKTSLNQENDETIIEFPAYYNYGTADPTSSSTEMLGSGKINTRFVGKKQCSQCPQGEDTICWCIVFQVGRPEGEALTQISQSRGTYIVFDPTVAPNGDDASNATPFSVFFVMFATWLQF